MTAAALTEDLKSHAPSSDPSGDEPTGSPADHRRVLKSSAVIASSSVMAILIGMIRTKAMAVVLGPAGFGLMALYTSIADLCRTVVEMGINNSGIRQIAEATGTGEPDRVARTAITLRRVALTLALVVAVAMCALAPQISQATFGDTHHANAIRLLSLAAAFKLVADGYTALVQGTRRMTALAGITIYSALAGALVAVPMVYFLKMEGLVPSLVVAAAASMVVAWWYARRVPIAHTTVTISQTRHEINKLLTFGFAFMASAMVTLATAYLIRMLLARESGLLTAGLYQSAWTLGGLYVGLVLQAMGTDYYPRLVAMAEDSRLCNALVNEQTYLSLLLSLPGVVGTLGLATFALSWFYSSEFMGAEIALKWICVGMAVRVVVWPLGFVIIAKGHRTLFVTTELAWAISSVGLAWMGHKFLGLEGAAIAFPAACLLHGILVYCSVRHLTGFRWERQPLLTGAWVLLFICLTAALPELVTPAWKTVTSIFLLIASAAFSARAVISLAHHGTVKAIGPFKLQ